MDKGTGLNKGDDIVNRMYDDLFDYIYENKKLLNGYTLYAHNLGRFDSIFLLRPLCSSGKYNVRAFWHDNSILILKIKDMERNVYITIRDSLRMIPISLDQALKSYGCASHKGIFPHKFVSKDLLNYIGPKPNITYYVDENQINDSNLSRYNNLPNLFDLKEACLAYLDKDVQGLLELMNVVSKLYYKDYNLNITRYSTLPAITKDVFGVKFHDENYRIKMIKGPIDTFIRQAYFGGNSNIFVTGKDRLVKDGFHYEMNSQFPNAMLQKMPTGNPVFSNNKDINYYNLGLVFALITPPSKDRLPNLFIQTRNEDGSVSCPREAFYEYIATPDLRQGMEYGYKFYILCGVNFPDACSEGELFGGFVNHFYDIKCNATDPAIKGGAKLSLNSLYGKFAQKEHDYTIKLVSNKDAQLIIKRYHYSYMSEISKDYTLIKSGPKLNDKLRRLFVEQIQLEQEDPLFSHSRLIKERGIPSAVQISAIISSYARTSINIFKNIPDNLAIASNTDSLILRKP
jgi:hypothetical protein